MRFGLKDLFTSATIVIGFLVVPVAATGRLHLASILILIGTACDLADGFVARLTGTANRFGAELDTIGDLIIFSVAPGALVYFALAPEDPYVAGAIGSLPVLFGSLRLARFNVHRIEFPGYWIGLTRPGVAAVVVSWLNTELFHRLVPYPIVVTAVLVTVVSLLNMSFLPYVSHHKRSFGTTGKVVMGIVLLALVTTPFVGVFWELCFLISITYLISPMLVPRAKRSEIRAFVTQWRKEQSESLHTR